MARPALWSDAIAHGQHTCGIIGTQPDRLQMVSGFVRHGLAAGDRVWCFPNGCRSAVLDRLRRDDSADDDALASGQLTVLPTHESALGALASEPDEVIDGLRRAVDEALDAGWNGFRLVGDLGWATRGRCCPERLMDFEIQVGEVLASSPATALCQYDRYRYDAATMAELTRVHAVTIGTVTAPVGEELSVSPLAGVAGLRLAGEVDLSTRETFRTALDDTLPSQDDLHLELSELRFIDVAGVQVMLLAMQRLRPGKRMIVHRAPRSLQLALDLLRSTNPDLVGLVDLEAEPI